MLRFALVASFLVMLVLASDADTETVDDANIPSAEESHRQLNDILKDMKIKGVHWKEWSTKFCERLRSVHLPYLEHKMTSPQEAHFFRNAQKVGHVLSQQRDEHLKKDHGHFSCQEAKETFAHEHIKEFMDHFKVLIEVPLSGHSHATIRQKLIEFRDDAEAGGLVNSEAIDEFNSVIQAMSGVEALYNNLKSNYDKVLSESSDCVKRFVTFINELESVVTDHFPNWEHLHDGANRLLEQCEDKSQEL